MTKFNISVLQKKKLVDMIKGLIPKVKSVRFKRDGVVSIRTGFLRYTRLHISEICLTIIPIKINTLRLNLEDSVYDPVYNKYLFIVANILNNNGKANDVIDYLYSEYSLLKYNIKRIDISTTVEIPEQAESVKVEVRYLPVISPLSPRFINHKISNLSKFISPGKDSYLLYIKRLLSNITNKYRYKSRKKKTQLRMLLQVNLK